MIPSKKAEEYYRRMMLKLVREAGTLIRKEAIKRQSLTAEINLGYAESLRKLIQEDYELLSKPLEDNLKEAFQRFSKGEDLGDIFADWLFGSVASTVQASLIRPIPEMEKHISDVNNFITSVINPIINALRKEGIYLIPLEPIVLPQQIDVPSLARDLKKAINIINASISILKGLIEIHNIE